MSIGEETELIDASSARIVINRPLLRQDEVDEHRFIPATPNKQQLVKGCVNNRLKDLFPPLQWIPKYKKQYLPGDIISGMTVSMIRLPQGLAYGLLAGLAPINGVYLEFFQCMIYSLLSTVPQNSVGTFSIIALMTGSVLDKHFPIAPGNESIAMNASTTVNGITDYWAKVEMGVSLSFLVGVLNIAFGLLNLGCMSILLAKPVVAGFTTASAIIVTLAQGTHIFGVTVTRYSGIAGPLKTFASIVSGIFQGVNSSSVIISAVSIPFLYAAKMMQIKYKDRLKGFPIPAELFLVIITTIVCYFVTDANPDLIIVGEVPGGLPMPKVPPVASLFGKIFSDAVPIAIVAYSTTLSLAKIFAAKKKFSWSANQEGFALGAAHIVSSFFSCFPGAAALARSSLQESAGGNTHLASMVSAGVMLLIIQWIGPIFRTLPRAVLSCIVVVNLRGMFLQFKQLPLLWRVSRIDFIIWISSFCGVLVFGVDLGLLFGIAVLLIGLVYTNSKPSILPIDQFKESEFYFHQKDDNGKPLNRGGNPDEMVQYFEFTGPLNFVSAANLAITTDKCVIDFARVSSIDSVGLAKFVTEAKGRYVMLVNANRDVRSRLESYDDFSTLNVSFHPTLLDAKYHCQ